jgi:hypothetical protein
MAKGVTKAFLESGKESVIDALIAATLTARIVINACSIGS